MALTKEQFQAFETIVGSRFISDDAGILDTYTQAMAQGSAHMGPVYRARTPRPAAVVLPGSVDEVQKIIRLCNEYKIKFKASSTFWSAMGYPGQAGAIQMDMRRMNSIEIDDKNQFAVIGPYVTGATLQAEAMKYGLNASIIGAGSSCSVLAGCVSHSSMGAYATAQGNGQECMLGVEWVTPEGEIIRTGSLGSGAGWFCGEGPGPSARALFRGNLGMNGSMGVATKIAVRLFPWPGPPVLPSRGTVPAYKADLPDNFKCYTLCFPTWQAWGDALMMMYESEVAYIGHRQFVMFGKDLKVPMLKILTDPDKQLCDLETLDKDPECIKEGKDMNIDIQITIAGFTKRDMELKENTIDYILEKTGGWKSEFMLDKEMMDFTLLYFIRIGHKNLNYAMCGAYEGNFGMIEQPYFGTAKTERAAGFKLEWEKKSDAFVRNGGDTMMLAMGQIGGGGNTGWEAFVNYDPADEESCRGTYEYFEAANKYIRENGFGPDMGRSMADARGDDGYELTQEDQNNLFINSPQPLGMIYQWKIREAFNPNRLMDAYWRTLDPDFQK